MRAEDWLTSQPGWGIVDGFIYQYARREPPDCPGYTTRLPHVTEVAQAWGWWNKSQLAIRYPDANEQLMDLVELFNYEMNAAREWYREKTSKK